MSYYPTVFIGCGPSGELALWHLKKRFFELTGNCPLPAYVRFLWIGMQHCPEKNFDETLCEKLAPNEQMQLNPDFNQLKKLLHQSGSLDLHWWSGANRSEHSERDDARMAYIYETRVIQNQFLNEFLQDCTRDMLHEISGQKYRVYLFGAMDEIDSGFILDLAIDLKKQTAGRISFLVPWFFIRGLGEITHGNRWVRSSSFLRELELMMLSQAKITDETNLRQPGFREGQLFDNIFLFDDVRDVDLVACQAVGFLEEKIASRVNAILINPSSSLAIANIRSYSVQVPILQLYRLCAIQFVRDCFFHNGMGIVRRGIFLGADHSFSAKSIEIAIEDFLNGEWNKQGQVTTSFNPLPFQFFVHVYRKAKDFGKAQYLANVDIKPGFIQGIRSYFNQYRPGYIQNDLGQLLSWQYEFLKQLRQYFADVRVNLRSQRMYRQNNVAQDLGKQIPQLLDTIDLFQREIRDIRQQIANGLHEHLKKYYQKENELFKNIDLVQNSIIAPVLNNLVESLLVDLYQAMGEEAYTPLLEKLNFMWETQTVSGQMSLAWRINNKQYKRVDLNEVILGLVDLAEKSGISTIINNLSIIKLLDVLSPQEKNLLVSDPPLKTTLRIGNNTNFQRRYLLKTPSLHGETIRSWMDTAGTSLFSNHMLISDDNSQLLFLEITSQLEIQRLDAFSQSYILNRNDLCFTLSAIQNVSQVEDEIDRLRRLSQLYINPEDQVFPVDFKFSVAFSRFFTYPQRLELIVWWTLYQQLGLVRSELSRQFYLRIGHNHMVPLSDVPKVPPAENILSAYEAFIFRLPLEAINNQHPLHSINCNDTYHSMNVILEEMKKQNKLTLDNPEIQNLFRRLNKPNDAYDDFYHDLSVYIKYLIRKDEFKLAGIL